MSRFLPRLAAALTALVATAGAAFAQQDSCRYYRSQLAALEQSGGGGRDYAALAERQARELGRMQAYYRSLGCERGQFLFFGAPPSPECGPAAQRLRSMEANYARLARQAGGGGGGPERRQALLAAIERACNPQTAAVDPRPRGLLESLFGVPAERRPAPEEVPLRRPEEGAPGEEPRGTVRIGGGKPVCVRSCDGAFFPVGTLPGGRAGGDEYCQALCPGTETALFYLPGDSDLGRAVSSTGKPYTSLAGAFRFQRSVDAGCTCRREGQSWVEALRQAEEMIERRRGDILVTAQKAEELSRPKADAKAPASRAAEAKAPRPEEAKAPRPEERPAADEADSRAAAEAGAAAPTASTESAGIGPKSIESGPVVGRDVGRRQEVVTDTGAKRSVRVVAPDVVPVPTNRM